MHANPRRSRNRILPASWKVTPGDFYLIIPDFYQITCKLPWSNYYLQIAGKLGPARYCGRTCPMKQCSGWRMCETCGKKHASSSSSPSSEEFFANRSLHFFRAINSVPLRIPGDCRCRSLLQLKVLPSLVTAQRVSFMQFEPSHIVLLVILAPWPWHTL